MNYWHDSDNNTSCVCLHLFCSTVPNSNLARRNCFKNLHSGQVLTTCALALQNSNMVDRTRIKLLFFLKNEVKHEHIERKRSQELWRLMSRTWKRRWRYFMSIAVLLLAMPPINRKVWTLPRSCQWFDMAVTEFSDKEWCENFRLSKETYIL